MLQLNAANALPATTAVTLSNIATAKLNLNGNNQAIASLSGGGSVMLGSGTLSIGNANQTSYAGAISGTGGLTKTGAGCQVLSGSNNYGGATLVSGGVLALAGGSALPATTTLPVNASGSLSLADGTLRATGGRRPLLFLVDGKPLAHETAKREAAWVPEGPGFYRLSVLDADGVAASAQVRVR